MKPQHRWLAAGATAVIATVTLAACGSSPAPAGPATSAPPASAPKTAFGTADVAFITGTLRLENQSAALAVLVAGHTASTQLRQFAGHLREHDSQTRHLRDLMGEWHQPAPSPYTPGAIPPTGMGLGMMGTHDWNEMTHQHGHDFNDHWLDAMITNHTTEITLCRDELRSGASPQARALARTMLMQRQAELTQLHRWHHDHEHHAEHD